MASWTINISGNWVEITPNPTDFQFNPVKDVTTRKTINNVNIRQKPLGNNTKGVLDLTWNSIGLYWRNLFLGLFEEEKKFSIRSHMIDNAKEIWTVRIEEFNSSPKQIGDRWQLQMTLEEVGG